MFHGILADHHLPQLLTGATSRTFFWQIVQCVPCPASAQNMSHVEIKHCKQEHFDQMFNHKPGVGKSKRPGPGLGWWALGCLLLSEMISTCMLDIYLEINRKNVGNRIPEGGKTSLNPGHDKVQQCFHSLLDTCIQWDDEYFMVKIGCNLVQLLRMSRSRGDPVLLPWLGLDRKTLFANPPNQPGSKVHHLRIREVPLCHSQSKLI